MNFIANQKIGVRLMAGFALLALLVIVAGAFSLKQMSSIKGDLDNVYANRYQKISWLNTIQGHLYGSQVSMLTAIISPDQATIDKEIEHMDGHSKAVVDLIGKFEKVIVSTEGKRLLQNYIEVRTAYAKERSKVIEYLKNGKTKEARLAIPEIQPHMTAYNNALKELQSFQENQMKTAVERAESNYTQSIWIVIIVGLLGFLLALTFGYIITNGITKPLKEAISLAEQVAAGDLTINIKVTSKNETGILLSSLKNMADKLKEMLGQIQNASQNVASGSEQLSASSEQITRTMNDQSSRATQIATSAEEMSQTVIDIAKTASGIANSANNTAIVARKGSDVVDKSVYESQTIAETVKDSSAIIATLGEKSNQIGKIIGVIRDIADQTNLLALNAAIEAARAGEQGRGFAVVADEVRKLAEKTAKATSEISQMIKAIQKEVVSAVTAMDTTNKKVQVGLQYSIEAGEQLKTIVQSVDGLQSLVLQIASATEEMSATSETISEDIQAVAGGAKEISGGSDQIAQSSSELARLAGQLKNIVLQFKI